MLCWPRDVRGVVLVRLEKEREKETLLQSTSTRTYLQAVIPIQVYQVIGDECESDPRLTMSTMSTMSLWRWSGKSDPTFVWHLQHGLVMVEALFLRNP